MFELKKLYLLFAGEKHEPLSWDLRVHIALDVARGLEYLHDGVSKLICTNLGNAVSVYISVRLNLC